MGYQTQNLVGYKMMTPTFKFIAGEKYPIDNFTCDGVKDDDVVMQVLDNKGQVSGTYYWWTYGGPEYPAGWFDFDGLVPAGVELAPGEGVFLYTAVSGATVQSAGEVPGEITVPVAGYKMVGNGSPKAIDIDELTIDGVKDDDMVMQVLDSKGQVSGTYYWWTYGGPEYPAGWFDFDGLIPAGITLNPGDTVFLYTAVSGATATIPAALAE